MKRADNSVSGGFANRLRRVAWASLAGVLLVACLSFAVVREMHAEGTRVLTASEQEWLTAHPVIRLAPDPDYPPIEYFDGQGAYRGLAADYVALVEERLGIKFEIHRYKSWDEVLEKTRDGEIDVWGAATQTARRLEYMLFTEPYVQFPSVIIVRENVTESLTLEKLYGMKVAVVSGYADNDFLISRYPNLIIDEVPTVATGLNKVSFGMADALVTNLGAATYIIEKEGIANLRMAGDTGYVHRLGFAVRKDWPEFAVILHKALEQIGPSQRERVFQRWIRLERDSLFRKRGFWLGILGGTGALALLIAGLLIWNRSLQSLVAQRTRELSEELRVRKQAEAALEMAHWELELKVEDRTAELTKANISLQAEISQRTRAEEALIQSEQRYREVFEYTSDGIFILDPTPDGRFRCADFNPAEEEISGLRVSEVIGRFVDEFLPQHLVDIVIGNYRRCIESGSPISYEEKLDFGARQMVFYTTLIPLKDAAGNIYRIIGVARDITERIKAEEQLRTLTERLALATGIASMGVWDYDARANRATWNDRMFEIYGMKKSEFVVPEDWLSMLLPEDRSKVLAFRQRSLERTDPEMMEFGIRRGDGSVRYIQAAARGVTDGEGKLVRVVGFNVDITERKRVEEALRRSEERYRLLFNSINDAVAVYEGSIGGLPGRFVEVNDMACRMSGYTREEFLELEPAGLLNDPVLIRKLPSFMERLMEEGLLVREISYTTKTGKKVPVEVISHLFELDGKPMVLTCARDISERRKSEQERDRLEAQLRHAQKMEAIGTLAGGIAHDFNNILAAIIGYTEIMLADSAVPKDAHESLDVVLKAALRARDLVRQILVFSRMKGMGERVPVDFGALVRETVGFLRATLPASIEIRSNLDGGTGSTLADPTQLQQVLVNLCTNAAHAMEENGGVLDLTLERTEVLEQTMIRHTMLKPGSYMLLTVCDTGHGMPPETLERIFDPYFTTKEVGKGSGLGLAVVHGVIDRHEGAVTVRSEPGRGTTFHVYLPRTPEAIGVRGPDSGTLPGGSERILFVDDEESIVAVAQGMLQMLGYQVVGKTDCVEALRTFQAAPDRYDLVITDFTMPRMNGVEFAREIIRARAGVPVILCTGFSERTNEEKARGAGIRAFAMKPLNMRELAELVRSTLDG